MQAGVEERGGNTPYSGYHAGQRRGRGEYTIFRLTCRPAWRRKGGEYKVPPSLSPSFVLNLPPDLARRCSGTKSSQTSKWRGGGRGNTPYSGCHAGWRGGGRGNTPYLGCHAGQRRGGGEYIVFRLPCRPAWRRKRGNTKCLPLYLLHSCLIYHQTWHGGALRQSLPKHQNVYDVDEQFYYKGSSFPIFCPIWLKLCKWPKVRPLILNWAQKIRYE